MPPLRSCLLTLLLALAAGLGTSSAADESDQRLLGALIEWANQEVTEAPTDENRNTVVVTTEQLAHGAVTALGMNVSGNFPARALVLNRYAGSSEFVFQRAFHVGEYQGETTLIFSYRTRSEMYLYRLTANGTVRGAWHADLSDTRNVTSQRNLDQAEAADGLQTELEFWREQLRIRQASAQPK
jgi:hypothetical protein